MHFIDWFIIVGYLVWIVYDGLKRTKAADEIEGYFLAKRSMPWWAAGLSVMATQLSAITMVSTTGQGYSDGLRFVQFYFGLPIAMVILSITLVPFFYRARVYTAYEYLERRFDPATRALASLLFLVSRGLQVGVIIAAPAVILSIMLGWDFTLTALAIGAPTALYTMFGGVQAVTWTDVKQMVVIVAGLSAAVTALILGLPDQVSLHDALQVAGSTGRLQSIDFTFDLNQTYTFWSGMIGGLFLMLGYFGCDQSQVQRYLTARSLKDARQSLLISAFAKVPLQALILLTGVLVFVFYVFHEPPMLFNPAYEARVRASGRAAEYAGLEQEFHRAFDARRVAADAVVTAHESGSEAQLRLVESGFNARNDDIRAVRDRAEALVKQVAGDERYTDVNYVFPTFVIGELPIGLVGLIIAAIFAAAMSSISAELNSLSTATVIDFYRRYVRRSSSDAHYLLVAKVATGVWGAFAIVVALYAVNLGSLIEVVNRFGSFFYGSLLGVFMLAVGVPWANARGAFWGMIGGMATVIAVAATTSISFLWLNAVGAIAVSLIGMAVSASGRRS